MAALDLRTKFKERYTKHSLSMLAGATIDVNKTNQEYDKDKRKKKRKKKDKDKKKNIIAIGITSGNVYSGLVGGAGSRLEYTVMGDKVNLAAMLMELSKNQSNVYGEIAVDESIKSKVNMKYDLEWKFIKTTKVKAKNQPVNVYSPIPLKFQNHIAKPPTAWLTDASDKTYIAECCRVTERLLKHNFGKVVFVEGEAGLGKAALISGVMNRTKKRIWWLWGKSSWVHETRENIKFPVWKQILLSLQLKYPFYLKKNRKSFESYIDKRRPDLRSWLFLVSYFDLLSFVSSNEYDPLIHIEKDKKDLTATKLRGTIWERNDRLIQGAKDKIQMRMSDEIRRFEELLRFETDENIRKVKKLKKEEEWGLLVEKKVNKQIGNFIYDI
eukprot:86280_1